MRTMLLFLILVVGPAVLFMSNTKIGPKDDYVFLYKFQENSEHLERILDDN